MITPSQIREKRLSTVQNGGYDKEEVNTLLAQIVESYQAVFDENKELYRKMEILAGKIEEYRSEEDSIKTALITAQKMADRITKDAKEKAEEKLSESAATAQQTVTDAKEKADKMVAEARTYAANFTKEKQEAAESIISEAESKANEAINGAKVVAQEMLNQAKQLSEDLVSKAKSEKAYHEQLIEKLRNESKSFKDSLLSLYESQMSRLGDMVDLKPQVEQDQANIDSVESEMNQIISNIDEINKLQSKEDDAAAEAEDDAPKVADDAQVDEIIDEIEENAEHTPAASPEEVNSALHAFTEDEITPLDENAPTINEIDEEPELEKVAPAPAEQTLFDEQASMPFEDYFHVKSGETRTDETISLTAPDEDEDEYDEVEGSSKLRGFFKKKK